VFEQSTARSLELSLPLIGTTQESATLMVCGKKKKRDLSLGFKMVFFG